MTTEAAAAQYLKEHLANVAGLENEVFNPLNKPLDKLPIIFVFNNGGDELFKQGLALAQNGVVLGSHACSDEAYMPNDLGVLKGTRPDRHTDSYQKHYQFGYRMVFVPSSEIKSNEELQKAIAKYNSIMTSSMGKV